MPGVMIYPSFRRDFFRGQVDLMTQPVKAVLVGTGYKPDKGHSTASDLTDEIEGPGYVQGGQELTGKAIEDADEDVQTFRATDLSWPDSTLKARGLVLCVGKKLVCHYDFGRQRQSDGGNFLVKWDPEGIFTL